MLTVKVDALLKNKTPGSERVKEPFAMKWLIAQLIYRGKS